MLLKTAIKSHDKGRPHTSQIPNWRVLVSTPVFVGRIRKLNFTDFIGEREGRRGVMYLVSTLPRLTNEKTHS